MAPAEAPSNEKPTGFAAPVASSVGDGDAEQGSRVVPSDKDVALALVGDHAQHIDQAVEARVVRKIDFFLIPAMIIGIYTAYSLLKLIY